MSFWNGTKLTTIRVRTQEFEVFVNKEGTFGTRLDGEDVTAESLEKLKAKLEAATKRKTVKMSIDFAQLDDDGQTYPGTVTGIHSNGNLITRWPGRKGVEQISRYGYRSENHSRPLSDAERAEWKDICDAEKALRARREKFLHAVKLDIREVAKLEMAKLTGVVEEE